MTHVAASSRTVTFANPISTPMPPPIVTDNVDTKPAPIPKPLPVPAPKPLPAPPKPLPAPGAHKAMSLKEHLNTALYYGVQPPVYAYLAAARAVQDSVALAGIAVMTPVIATEQGLETGVASAYKFLHDPKAPDAPLQRVAGVASHLVGDGVAGGVESVRAAYAMGGQGLITAAVGVPVAGAAALVGFGTLGVTVPLACLYGAVQSEVKTPTQFFDEVRRGKHRLPQ